MTDGDEDGLADWWEIFHFGNLAPAPDSDFDEDGLTNVEELAAGTDPRAADSDGDGLGDGHELGLGLDPLRPEPVLVGHYTFEGKGNAVWQNHGTLGGVAEVAGAGIGVVTDLDSPAADGRGTLGITIAGDHLDTDLRPFQMSIAEGDYTMAAWVRPSEIVARGSILSQPDSGAWFNLWLSSGKPTFYHNRGGGRASTGAVAALETNRWRHLTWRHRDDQLEIFLDGERVAAAENTLPMASRIGPLWIGAYNTTYAFLGRLDDVQIYRGALDDERIRALATGNTGADTDTDGLADFREWVETGTLALAPEGDEDGFDSPIGQDGNLQADPRFLNAAAENFHLQAESPAIDAADSTQAPAFDFANVPRADDPDMSNTGVPGPDGLVADLGALEFAAGLTSRVALSVPFVGGPDVAIGPWLDEIRLRPLGGGPETALLLGRFPVTDDTRLDTEAVLERTAEVRMPFVADGAYRWEVITDRDRRFATGGEAFVGGLSSTLVQLTAPLTPVDAALVGAFSTAGEPVYFKIHPPADSHLRVTAAQIVPTGVIRLFATAGRLPQPADFDAASTE